MRGGRFLAEESPAEILQRYNTDSLEDAFLKLSIMQNKGKRRRSSISSAVVAAQAAANPVSTQFFFICFKVVVTEIIPSGLTRQKIWPFVSTFISPLISSQILVGCYAF